MVIKNNKIISIYEKEYLDWVSDLKKRYKQSQIKAAIKVNSELIKFYWSLGRDIIKMKSESKWGSKFYEVLSKDLKENISDSFCFSIRNLRYMKQFYELFNENEITQQVVAQIEKVPWGHIILLLNKVSNNLNKAIFYINKIVENNWSRSTLSTFLDNNLYERSNKTINNFELNLPDVNSDLAKEILKDPYSFNFLTMEEKFSGKELKDTLINNIHNFLIELGTGFAYMGREYRLDVAGSELFIDMLFYNTKIHAYVVIEVKTIDFKPDFVGQLGTYVVAVDHILKTNRDEKTIGILICKNKNDILARYSLESSNQPLGISSFELSKLISEKFKSSLPTIEEIENELNKK